MEQTIMRGVAVPVTAKQLTTNDIIFDFALRMT